MTTEFILSEATIQSVTSALADGVISCEEIVVAYLKRIDTLDQCGELPINSFIATNAKCVEEARHIDTLPMNQRGPLAGIPIVIKDNIDLAGMPTTAGCFALRGNFAKSDATIIRKLRAAGAIFIGKTNLAEFSWTGLYSTSSVGGLSRNPYDTLRTTGGSSGGTAAAVAANFAVAGVGTDTGASVRGPCAHQNLVGLRPTIGTCSRAGIIPVSSTRDTPGPMARCVADAAILHHVMKGFDLKDTSTWHASRQLGLPEIFKYTDHSIRGMRLGIPRQLLDVPCADIEVVKQFERAVDDLRSLGAVVVECDEPHFAILSNIEPPFRMKPDFDAYLLSKQVKGPVNSFAELAASGQYGDDVADFIRKQVDVTEIDRLKTEGKYERLVSRLRREILRIWDREHVAAFIFPTWMRPPDYLENIGGHCGNNNRWVAHVGFPAISVPMGNTIDGLPTGLQIAGRPFTEEVLLLIANDYEKSTRHRNCPMI